MSAELSSPEVVDLRVMLEAWQDALDTNFLMIVALQQGWDDPERLHLPFGQALALIRLQTLDRQERQQEYLNLARTEGLMVQYLTRLATLGKLEEAMSAAQSRMTTAEESFALAKTLREKNHATRRQCNGYNRQKRRICNRNSKCFGPRISISCNRAMPVNVSSWIYANNCGDGKWRRPCQRNVVSVPC